MLVPHAATALARRGLITDQCRRHGLKTFGSAVDYVWRLSFDRNQRPGDWRLVLEERCGTCTTKHAALCVLAGEQGLPAHLRLGVYQMSEANTPGVGAILERYGLSHIPELYCSLHMEGHEIDIALPDHYPRPSEPRRIIQFWRTEPEGVGRRKADLHRRLLAEWLADEPGPPLTVDQAWRIRELCIKALILPIDDLSVEPGDEARAIEDEPEGEPF